jgi:hypothetical protein
MHESKKELFMNIINLETIDDKSKRIKNEINGKSGSAAGYFYDYGEDPTLAIAIKGSGQFLIEAHKCMTNSLNMDVFEILSPGIRKIGDYKKYDYGYRPSLTYSKWLGVADVHTDTNKSDLWLSMITVPCLPPTSDESRNILPESSE